MTLTPEKTKYLFVSQGTVKPHRMKRIALRVIEAAGMTRARGARVDTYPYNGGGGEGYTLYQPLMESYLVADVYTDQNITEVLISTCKPERMDVDTISAILTETIGATSAYILQAE